MKALLISATVGAAAAVAAMAALINVFSHWQF